MMQSLSSINKVYSLITQEKSNHNLAHVPIVDESSILTNAYEAKKNYGRGRGVSHGGSSKNNSRYCTYCQKYGHTVEFCYQKHRHPQINKFVNTYNINASESHNSSLSPEVNQQEPQISGLIQEKYDQLLCLLQQASLTP